MAGRPARQPRVDPTLVPSVVYCEPQVACFGLSEKEAAKRGLR